MNTNTPSGNLAELTKALQNLEPVELSFHDMKAIKILLNSPDGNSHQAFIVRKQDDKGATRFFFTGMNKIVVFDRAPEIWEKELKNWNWSFVEVKMKK